MKRFTMSILSFTAALLMLVFFVTSAKGATGDFTSRAAGNWIDITTWSKKLTGTVKFTSGSTAVVGTGTSFTTELVAGDVLMLQASTGTIRGTVASITDNLNLVLVAPATITTVSGAYSKEATPTSADGVITITHAVTVTANVTVDQVVLTSGTFTINSGVTLTVADGTGTDFTTGTSVNETINGTLNIDGTWMTGQNNTVTIASGGIMNVSSTGTFNINLAGEATASRLNVNGTINSSGTINTSRGNGGAVATINSTGSVILSGTAIFTVTLNTVRFDVLSGGTLEIGPSAYINGSGYLSVSSGANLKIGSADGINNSTTTGNVRTSSTIADIYNTGANYTYNGIAAQVTGNGLTGAATLKINNAAGVTLSRALTTLTTLTIGDVIANSLFADGGYAIATTGTLNLTSGTYRLGIAGTATTFPGFTIRNISAGTTVEYAAGVAQSVSNLPTYANLTFSGASTKTASGNLMVNENLTISAGTLSAGTYTHNVKGNWTNNGTFTAGTSTVIFSGSALQSIAGSSSTTFNNLTINNSAGITFSGSIGATVNGILTLTSGNITTGANTLIVSNNATGSVSRISGHIVGNLQRAIAGSGSPTYTFDVGTATSYTPVDVAFTTLSGAGNLTVKVVSGQNPNSGSPVNTLKDVDLYWNLTNAGVAFTNYAPTFHYNAGDIIGGANQSNFIVGQYTSSWTSPTPVTNAGSGPYTTQVTGLTDFSDFVVGENSACNDPTDGGTIATDQNGCSPFDPVLITSSALPTGFTGTLEYKWQESTTGSGSGFSDIASSNAATYDPGSLTVTTWYKRLARVDCMSDWTGAAESNVVKMTIDPVPVASIISASGAITFCEGNSVILSGNIDGVWSSGEITPTITVITSGDYFVTNTTACGSVTSNHIIVTVNPLPTASIISANGATTFCEGNSVVLSGNIDGTWNTGEITPTITVITSGDYFVTNTNAWCSITSNHIIVTVDPCIDCQWCNQGSVLSQVLANMGDRCDQPDILVDVRLPLSYIDLASIGTGQPAFGSIQTAVDYLTSHPELAHVPGQLFVGVIATDPIIADPVICGNICVRPYAGDNPHGTENVIITNPTTSRLNVFGCSVTMYPLDPSQPVITIQNSIGKVTVLDLHVKYSSVQGYLINNNADLVVVKNSSAWFNDIGIDVNDDDVQVTGAQHINGNRIGILVEGNNNILRTNSDIIDNTYYGIIISGNGNESNGNEVGTIGHPNANGILVSGSNNNGNGIHDDQVDHNTGFGINITGNGNLINEEDVEYNGDKGIVVSGDSNTVNKCTKIDNNGSHGIYVTGATNILSGNESDKNLGDGINANIGNGATGNKLSKNVAKTNNGYGIRACQQINLGGNKASGNGLNPQMSFTCTIREDLTLIDDLAGMDNSFDLYPNPTQGDVTIKFNSTSIDKYFISIIDMTSRVVSREVVEGQKGQNVYNVDLSKVAKGIYMLVIENTVMNNCKKLIVQ